MKTTIHYICGRPYLAVRVASYANGVYTNYANPSKNKK